MVTHYVGPQQLPEIMLLADPLTVWPAGTTRVVVQKPDRGNGSGLSNSPMNQTIPLPIRMNAILSPTTSLYPLRKTLA